MSLDVCLVSMPYGPTAAPSVGIGLLVAAAKRAGLTARAVYANLWFAARVGLLEYTCLSEVDLPEDLIGEWTFSGAAFPEFTPDHDAYLASRTKRFGRWFPKGTDIRKVLWDVRRQADGFITEVAERVLELNPRIVGCSSTYQQHCASLALCRRIKEMRPEVVTILGGANCAGAMGAATQRAFPWVDRVVSGEADDVFPSLCRAALDRSGKSAVRVAATVPGATTPIIAAEPIASLDDLPIPDYDDYFAELEAFPYKDFIKPCLPVETSRGCWWGQKSRCTFCGLVEEGMVFRSKSAARVQHELHALAERHAINRMATTDLILDMRYFRSLLPELAASQPPPYVMCFDTKSNLTEEQVECLAQAGVRWIVPGIENLNDDLLKLLNKGNTALGNVALLKYAHESGVRVLWNLLTEIPGEQDSCYQELAGWLPWIAHLPPPTGVYRVRFDRFSRYYGDQERYGLSLRAEPSYAHVYPLVSDDLEDLAYFFKNDNRDTESAGPGLAAVRSWVEQWHRLRFGKRPDGPPPDLTLREEAARSVILDTRPCGKGSETVLDGAEHLVHRACRHPRSLLAIRRELGSEPGVAAQRVDEAVESLVSRKLLLRTGEWLLALATIPARRPLLPRADVPGGFNSALVRPEAVRNRRLLLDAVGNG